MPCLEESAKDEVDVAIQILDIVTQRHHVNQVTPQVVREITQTDQLNKKLLTTFLERMNVMEISPTSSQNDSGEDENGDEFED